MGAKLRIDLKKNNLYGQMQIKFPGDTETATQTPSMVGMSAC